MDDAGSSRPPETTGAGALAYPTNRVIAAVDPAVLGALIPDLSAAGFAPIGLLGGEAGLRRLGETGGGSGIGGLLRGFAKSTGGELDYIRRAEQELRDGHVLVDVEVAGDDEKGRARDVLLRHGSHAVVYFGHWALETLA